MTAQASQYKVHGALRDAQYLAHATERLRDDIGRMPSGSEWPRMLIRADQPPEGWNGPYVDALREDPWGRALAYVQRDDAPAGFHVYSFGRDGADDGGGADDVSSWTGYDEEIYFPHRRRDRLLVLGGITGTVLGLACGIFWLCRFVWRRIA